MSAPAATVSTYARSTGQPRRLVLDPWVIGTVAALLLIGLVMVASASIGISEKETGHAFYYFQRQLVYVLAGLVAAAIGLAVPTRTWDRYSMFLMAGALVLLLLVLVPGIGYSVNGARRWVRLGLMNFQVSEIARVMLLTYVASYAVRRADELRSSFAGFMKPVGVLVRGGRACCWSSRTSAPPRSCSPRVSPYCSSPARACITCSCPSSSARRRWARSRSCPRTACVA